MSESYQVQVKVLSQKGTCRRHHKVGDKWIIGTETPGGLCVSAFNSLYPNAKVLMYGGTFPWTPDPDAITEACPDPDNPVVFEVRRLRKQDGS